MASDSLIVGIETAIQEIRDGRMVILVDDEGRENEGDLCCAAEAVTPEFINFMAIHGRGLICLTLEPQKADQLGLNPMVRENNSPFETAFTVSIDAACGITTGISAQDRAHTIRQAMSPTANPSDFVRPGHIFPLRRGAAAFWFAPAKPKAPWIWPGWPVLNPPVSSVKS